MRGTRPGTSRIIGSPVPGGGNLLLDRPAERRPGVPELHDDREMVVARHVHDLDVETPPSPCGGERLRLAMVLVALLCSEGEQKSAGGSRDAMDRAVP